MCLVSMGDQFNWFNAKGFSKNWIDWLSFYFFGSQSNLFVQFLFNPIDFLANYYLRTTYAISKAYTFSDF